MEHLTSFNIVTCIIKGCLLPFKIRLIKVGSIKSLFSSALIVHVCRQVSTTIHRHEITCIMNTGQYEK